MGVRDDDDALDALDHDGLLAYLNRLYASAGEAPLSGSAAKASTDDELRGVIAEVRRRQAQRREGTAAAPPRPARAGRVLDRRGGARDRAGDSDRVLCVLATANETTVALARALMRSRGVPLVVADTAEALGRVLVSVTPTHLVIEVALGVIRIGDLLGARAADVRVFWSDDGDATLAALEVVS